MVKNIIQIKTIIILLGFILGGCQKFEDVKIGAYNAEFAIPIFQGKASMSDILDNIEGETYLTIDNDGLFNLNYQGDVASFSSSDIFALISNTPPFPVDTFMALPFDIPGNVDVDLIQLKSGVMTYSFQTNTEENVFVKITIPQARRYNQVFSETVEVSYEGSIPTIVQAQDVDLTGYSLTTANDTLFIGYEAKTNSGELVTLDNFFMIIRDLEFAYAEGNLGSEPFDTPRDTIAIDFFKYWTQGSVLFEAPRVTLTVQNSFGFPFRAKANFINFITASGETLPLESSFIDNGFDVNYPGLYEVGLSKTTLFSFDRNNSNIRELIAAGPIAVDYDVEVIPNPDSLTEIRGFMTDASDFDIQMEVELPIEGKTSGFATQDTFDISFEEYDEVDFAEFKLISSNELPLGVEVQVYFVNSIGEIIDSLFASEQVVLDPAPVNENGEVVGTSEQNSLAPLTAEQFSKIKFATQGYLQVRFSTSNQGTVPVKILASQEVDLRLGMRIGFKD